MKKILTLLMIIIAPMMTLADEEEEVLIDLGKVEHGGFGAPVMKITSIAGEIEMLSGGRGAWVLNHQLALGFGAYSSEFHNVKSDIIDPFTSRKPHLEFSQFGFEVEYLYQSNKKIHYTGLLFLGVGTAEYELYTDALLNGDDYDPSFGDDKFIVIEPMANVELNLFKWFRVAAGVGYRLTIGANYEYQNEKYTGSDFNGLFGALTFKFGIY